MTGTHQLGKGTRPLIVGITGHRNLSPASRAVARQTLRSVLTTLRGLYPRSQVHVMTGMAEGADQVAAEEAFALGIPVIAALPMSPAIYETTMSDDAARAGLRAALARADLTMVLPTPVLGDGRPDPSPVVAYERLGLVLARASHVLVALWDGSPHAGDSTRGGSAHVVCLRVLPAAALAQGVAQGKGDGMNASMNASMGDGVPGAAGPTLRLAVVRGADGGGTGRGTDDLGRLYAVGAGADGDLLQTPVTDLSDILRDPRMDRLEAANASLDAGRGGGGASGDLMAAITAFLPQGGRLP